MWSTSNDGPANVAVNELFWLGNKLVAVTHGRGMFSITPQIGPPVVVAAQATLTAENCVPANGVPDPGESITVSFALKNTGGTPTSNLVATLLATNGVTSPGSPQNYGALTFARPGHSHLPPPVSVAG